MLKGWNKLTQMGLGMILAIWMFMMMIYVI